MKMMVTLVIRRDPAAMALVPAEQAHIHELQAQGKVDTLYVGTRSHAWLVMGAESEDEVRRALEAFPLRPYMDQIDVEPLMS